MFTLTEPKQTAKRILREVKNISQTEYRFFRRFAEQLIYSNLNNKNNSKAEIIHVGNALRNYVRYTLEPDDIETVKSPLAIIRDLNNYGVLLGDCDDFTLFVCLVFYVLGYEVGCKIVEQYNDGYYSHIYPMIADEDGNYLAVDLCTKNQIGYEYNDIITSYIFYNMGDI